jgi:glycosidase
VNREVILLAEAEAPEEQLKAFDMSYNFSYYPILRGVLRDGEPAEAIRHHWEKQKARFPLGARMLHYSDNHDLRRAVLEFGEKGSFAASVLNFTLDGIPFLFNGQEIADTDLKAPLDRIPIRWEGESPGAPLVKAHINTLEGYKKLFELRRCEPALSEGELVWINNSEPDSVLTFLRRKGDDEIFVAVNLSNRKHDVVTDLAASEYLMFQDLFTGTQLSSSLAAGKLTTTLSAYDFLIGKRLTPPVMNQSGRP